MTSSESKAISLAWQKRFFFAEVKAIIERKHMPIIVYKGGHMTAAAIVLLEGGYDMLWEVFKDFELMMGDARIIELPLPVRGFDHD